ncbi:mycothiol system anti-sigma-R factor [Georgenia sp. EYE_87]|uniref:mycothiol system anti-sigma-R factor n=1 Tax=Georgenia sp. EYE_87 TaxID=2853448 RepID=UPI0020058D6D|nr:mycothiol system anti-sigma-R factor [Georgenia sp. EYE_87]MCK6212665.1 mycothiol system anti-sigma-R factor [Georgenia sp. EYE_87]
MSEDTENLTERAEKALRARAEGRTTPCSCDELLEHLFEFLDSELDEDQVERFRRHAAECPTCTEATDAEQHIRALVRRSCAEVAPSSLRLRVQSQLTVLRVNGIRAVD